MKKPAGFSLPELLMVVVLLGVLLVLTLPALNATRTRASQTKCLSNMRGAQMAVIVYSYEQRDALPFAGFNEHFVPLPMGGSVRIGGRIGLSNGAWSALFPDEWLSGEWSASLRCSGQKRYDPSLPAPPFTYRSFELPVFWMSSATWLDASVLKAGRDIEEFRPACNVISAVSYPSKKVMLFEQNGLCVVGRDAEYWKFTVGQTFSFATSTALMDGSVLRTRQIDGLPAVWTMPFNATVDGVFGRDLR